MAFHTQVWRVAGKWGLGGTRTPRLNLGRREFPRELVVGDSVTINGEEYRVVDVGIGYIDVEPKSLIGR